MSVSHTREWKTAFMSPDEFLFHFCISTIMKPDAMDAILKIIIIYLYQPSILTELRNISYWKYQFKINREKIASSEKDPLMMNLQNKFLKLIIKSFVGTSVRKSTNQMTCVRSLHKIILIEITLTKSMLHFVHIFRMNDTQVGILL